jgi:hypothetical protein
VNRVDPTGWAACLISGETVLDGIALGAFPFSFTSGLLGKASGVISGGSGFAHLIPGAVSSGNCGGLPPSNPNAESPGYVGIGSP